MSSTFGEILEPVSRTAWEDWDDINPERSTKDLKWSQDLESPEEIETFVMLEGKYLSECIKSQTNHRFELINWIPEVNLQLYKVKMSNKYICTIKNYNLVLSSEIVQLLRQYLTVSSNVVTIQTKALPEYQAMETSAQDCIIRIIQTSKSFKGLNIEFPKLEQPNMISGVSAGVITLREHLDDTGVAIVCFMEHPEEYQIEEIEKLLQKLGITEKSTSRPNYLLDSNLYI